MPCSVTTVIGYASLLVARNQALFSFGLLAVIGELACLATALLALPAVLRWKEQRRGDDPGANGGPKEPEESDVQLRAAR